MESVGRAAVATAGELEPIATGASESKFSAGRSSVWADRSAVSAGATEAADNSAFDSAAGCDAVLSIPAAETAGNCSCPASSWTMLTRPCQSGGGGSNNFLSSSVTAAGSAVQEGAAGAGSWIGTVAIGISKSAGVPLSEASGTAASGGSIGADSVSFVSR